MINALFGRRRRLLREAAEELMARLAEKASLVVDDRLVKRQRNDQCNGGFNAGTLQINGR